MSADAGGIMAGMIEIIRYEDCSVLAYPDYQAVRDAYAAEAAHPEIAPARENRALFEQLAAAGMLRSFAAVEAGRLVGFANGLIAPQTHYGTERVMVVDSVYALPEARRAGAGTLLLQALRREARKAGCRAITMSASPGTAADRLHARTGRLVQKTYLWSINDGQSN